ncbi:group 1 truncated hemoglobin [Streptomyces sp. NPDC088812]|uniref:group I truncated hemoglobin n=1 Tax=Streptomyces sp. NPDC088812 TaxID=3365905 RepID=UPI00380955C3
MTEPAQTPSLYERLGGTFGIAAVMDVLTDRLYENVSANRNPDVRKLHETNSRAGFKFMVTAWSIQETGGPKVYPGKDMRAAHENMVATEEDFDIVALEVAATLSYCGVAKQEAQEYMDIFESYREDVLTASARKSETSAPDSA